MASSRTCSPKNREFGFWDCSMIVSAICQSSGASCSCINALLAGARCGETGSYAAPTTWSSSAMSNSPLTSFWTAAWKSGAAAAVAIVKDQCCTRCATAKFWSFCLPCRAPLYFVIIMSRTQYWYRTSYQYSIILLLRPERVDLSVNSKLFPRQYIN